MAHRESLTNPAEVPLSLAFEVVRRQRKGELSEPREWMDSILGGASPQRILDEVEYQLGGDRPVDLSRWVMDEMPTHEAVFIDDKGDLIRAALLGILMRLNTDLPEPALRMATNVYSARERIMSELAAMEERPDEIAGPYQIVDFADRVRLLRAALGSAIDVHDRGLRKAILEARVDVAVAEHGIREGLEAEWAAGFPRALLNAAGCVRVEGIWNPSRPVPTISQLELKEFFVEDKIEIETMEMMGRAWARAFLATETATILDEARRSPARSWRKKTLLDRIERASRTLIERGHRPTHLLIPADWRLDSAIRAASDSWGGPPREDGFVGMLLGMQAYVLYEEFDSAMVLSLPAALRVEQQLIDGKIFSISVREVNDATLAELAAGGTVDAEGGPGETPEERLRLRTWVLVREAPLFSSDQSAIVRVALPDPLV